MPKKKGYSSKRSGSKKTGRSTSSRSRKSTRLEPAVRHLRFKITNSGDAGTETSHFLDIGKQLSALNRRLYPQGRDYFVKKITVTSLNTTSGFLSASTAPTSWPVHGSHKMALKMWNEMRLGHGGAPGSGLPQAVSPATWADFKVFLSDEHRLGTEVVCLDSANNLIKLGEWIHSKFQSPDGGTGADEYVSHILGAHVGAAGSRTSVGLIQAYEESRRTVQQDDTGAEIDTDSPWINLFDDGTTLDEIAQDMLDDGNLPPYDINEYPGGATNTPKPLVAGLVALSASSNVPPTSTTPTAVMGGFNVPCGLVEFEVKSSVADDEFDVIVEIASGSFKGVKALSM